jgi:hypothetical protein
MTPAPSETTMDDLVRQALAKWPNVPDCYGWLGLDARGQWYMRDDHVQAAGPFAQHKGSLLRHDKLISFIERNYEPDTRGCWYFQNGPQRVYVELEDTPLICRVSSSGEVRAHTGQDLPVQAVWTDERGHVYLQTAMGLGLVHSQDVIHAAELIERGDWTLQTLLHEELEQRFGFCRSPLTYQTKARHNPRSQT